MANLPVESEDRDLQRKQEVLEQFAEAQSGIGVGARPQDDLEDRSITDTPNRRITGLRGSAALGAAMLAAGIRPPGTGYHAHHIVPRGMNGAARAREILEKCNIGIDSAPNGVWLPGNFYAVNADGSMVHQGIHSAEYLALITRTLAGAYAGGGQKAVESAMTRLRQRIHEARS
jgi:hypothetical protein